MGPLSLSGESAEPPSHDRSFMSYRGGDLQLQRALTYGEVEAPHPRKALGGLVEPIDLKGRNGRYGHPESYARDILEGWLKERGTGNVGWAHPGTWKPPRWPTGPCGKEDCRVDPVAGLPGWTPTGGRSVRSRGGTLPRGAAESGLCQGVPWGSARQSDHSHAGRWVVARPLVPDD